MKQIISDFLFWFSISLIIIGYIMFRLVNISINKQKQKLEDPKKNLEKVLRDMADIFGNLIPKSGLRVNSNIGMIYIILAFLMAIGLIGLIITFTKYK